MAIKRVNQARPQVGEYRDRLLPFMEDESGIKAISSYIRPDGSLDRRALYCLEIINNLIKQKDEKVFQRIPQELFGGLSENSRTAIQASLLCRANDSAMPKEPSGRAEADGIDESGYTRIQKIIGQWAEGDGRWSDTPDGDQLNKGRINDNEIDGSESKVYFDKEKRFVYKTVEYLSHYSDLEPFMDKIHIHNAAFPYAPIMVEGFGIRETADDNTGFVLTIRQPYLDGRTPTDSEIEDGMMQVGFDKAPGDWFWEHKLGNVAIYDVSANNSVMIKDPLTGKEYLAVFDCDPFLKTFPFNKKKAEEFNLEALLPQNDRNLDGPEWRRLLGNEFDQWTTEQKTQLLKDLRMKGKATARVEGNLVCLTNAYTEPVTINDKTVNTMNGTVSKGLPYAFREEHVYTIPDLKYDDKKVMQIEAVLNRVAPTVMDMDEFLYTAEYVGENAARVRGGAPYRKELKDNLLRNGRLEGLLNGRYAVALDPSDKNRVLISDTDSLSFMLWTNTGKLDPSDDGVTFSLEEKRELARNKSVQKNGTSYSFNIAKGRIDRNVNQLKLRKKQDHKQVVSVNI